MISSFIRYRYTHTDTDIRYREIQDMDGDIYMKIYTHIHQKSCKKVHDNGVSSPIDRIISYFFFL